MLTARQFTMEQALFIIKEYLQEKGHTDFPIEFFINCDQYMLNNPHLLHQYPTFLNGGGFQEALQTSLSYFKRKLGITEYTMTYPNGSQLVYTDLVDGNPV